MSDIQFPNNITELSAILENEKKRYNLLAGMSAKMLLDYDISTDRLIIYAANDIEKMNVSVYDDFLTCLNEMTSVRDEDKDTIRNHIGGHKSGNIEIMLSQNGDEFKKVAISTVIFNDANGSPYQIFGILSGVDRVEDRRKGSEYDRLTGLPNIDYFKEKCRSAQRSDMPYAVVYCDINNFKFLNDSIGFTNGDRIIRYFSEVLTDLSYGHICAARVSADKFVYLVEYKERTELEKHINEINDEFHNRVKDSELGIRVSVVSGACILGGRHSVEGTIESANTARKIAKTSGESFVLYDMELEERLKREIDIIAEFDDAIDNREFVVYFQPKIAFQGEELIGMEALVRWQKPDGTFLPPDSFIPLMEKTGTVVKLDFYVYEESCKTIRKWLDKGVDVKPVSLNVSRAHVKDHNFAKEMRALVDKYGIPTNLIELELTESIFLQDVSHVVWLMEQLKLNGFSISIDDFGSGYSSLTILKDLPADVLKIDKEFFRKGDMKSKDKIIVSGVVSLAKNLKMKVLCEGVETISQVEFLKSIDCDCAQGYFFSRPIPLDEFEKKYYGEVINV